MNKDIFNMPKAVTIAGRTSSITNSFYNGIVPVIQPTDEEIKNALLILEQNEDDVRCVYCDDRKTEWDHLHPLIIGKKHTGYITEISNLVPSCGKCNQSKGNSNWKEWMLSDAKKSPKTRNIPNLDKKIALIEKYDNYFPKKIVDLEKEIDPTLWDEYMKSYYLIMENIEKAQSLMDQIKGKQIVHPSHKISKECNTVKLDLSTKQNINEYLKPIGKSTFVRYFPLLIDSTKNVSDIINVMKVNETYKDDSIKTKASAGKYIVNNGYAKDALKVISESEKVELDIRKMAEFYIGQYF